MYHSIRLESKDISMKYLGKGIGTLAIWGGVIGSLALLHSYGMLAPVGAAFIVFGGFVTTTQVWMDADVIAAFEKEKSNGI